MDDKEKVMTVNNDGHWVEMGPPSEKSHGVPPKPEPTLLDLQKEIYKLKGRLIIVQLAVLVVAILELFK